MVKCYNNICTIYYILIRRDVLKHLIICETIDIKDIMLIGKVDGYKKHSIFPDVPNL